MSRRIRQRWSNLQLRGKGAVVIAIPLAVLALGSVLSLVATHYDARSAASVSHSRDVESQLAAADGLLADVATERSDYLLVGDPRYLTSAQDDGHRLAAAISLLAARLAGEPAQTGRLAGVAKFVSADTELPVPARTASAVDLTGWLNASRAAESGAQAGLQVMDGAQSAVIAHRRAVASRWRSVDMYGSAALLALGLLGGIAGTRLFAKSIAARVDHLESEMTRMDPDSFTAPPDAGADELGRLARQFRATSKILVTREADLRSARGFLENILTVGPVVVTRTGGSDDTGYVSPNCERVLGLSAAQITSRDAWNRLAPEAMKRYDAAVNTLRAAEDAASVELEAEFELHGTRRHLSVLLMRDTADDDGGVLAFIVDVTARRRAEEEVAERQRELRAITAASPDIIAVFNADLELLWTSEAFTSVLGYRVSDRLGTDASSLMHDDDRGLFATAVRSVIGGGAEDFTVSVRVWHATGHWITLEGHGRPSLGPSGEPVAAVAVFRDVSERILLEAELVEARDAANAASVAKSDFLSRMSHELRTPLNVVLGFAQLLQMEDIGEEQQNWVGQILLSGRHLLDLINEVLDIARIESGALTLSPEAVSLPSIVAETVEAMRPIAAARGVTISADLGMEEIFVRADRQRLRQVMLNLLSNAVKYNKPGGAISVSLQPRDDTVSTNIRDTGIGIAPQYLQRLFVPFDRLGAEGSTVEGTGVGLSLSRGFVQAMEGDISVESTLGEGSTFTVALPRHACPMGSLEPASAGAASLAADRTDPTHGGGPAAGGDTTGTVLYIEDNVTNLHFMRRVIERRPGVRLVHALQGRLGLDLARSAHPDVVLLDLHLPDMSGTDVLLQLRGDPATRHVPVFIVSADATDGQVERMSDAGASGYLSKPLDVARILALLDDVLEST